MSRRMGPAIIQDEEHLEVLRQPLPTKVLLHLGHEAVAEPPLKEGSSHPRIITRIVMHRGMHHVLKSPRLLVLPYHKQLTLVCACSVGTRQHRDAILIYLEAYIHTLGIRRECGCRKATPKQSHLVSVIYLLRGHLVFPDQALELLSEIFSSVVIGEIVFALHL